MIDTDVAGNNCPKCFRSCLNMPEALHLWHCGISSCYLVEEVVIKGSKKQKACHQGNLEFGANWSDLYNSGNTCRSCSKSWKWAILVDMAKAVLCSTSGTSYPTQSATNAVFVLVP